MAFMPIAYNRSSGIGEGINSAAQNFIRAYQLGQARRLQQREANQREKLTEIQIAGANREAAMAPLREALIRGQAFQAGVKPAETASDTTFSLPTMPGTPGTLPLSQLPALTVSRDQRYVPLGGGKLPISDVSDATIANVPERGGFVYDTMDNPVAREQTFRSQQLDASRDAMRQQLLRLYTGQAFTAGQNALNRASRASEGAANRANQLAIAGIRHSPIGGPTSQTRQAIQAQIQTLRAQAGMIPKYDSIDRQLMGSTPDGQAAIDEADRQADEIRTRLESLYQRLDSLGTEANPPAASTSMVPHAGEPGVKPVIRGGGIAAASPTTAPTTASVTAPQSAAAGQPMDARQMALARAMAMRLQGQGLSREDIAAELRRNGFNVVP